MKCGSQREVQLSFHPQDLQCRGKRITVLGSCRGGPTGDRQDKFIKIILAAVYSSDQREDEGGGEERGGQSCQGK